MTDPQPLLRQGGRPVEVGDDTRHMRLSNPDLWARMTGGQRAAYDGGWLQATANIMFPSHRNTAADERQVP